MPTRLDSVLPHLGHESGCFLDGDMGQGGHGDIIAEAAGERMNGAILKHVLVPHSSRGVTVMTAAGVGDTPLVT